MHKSHLFLNRPVYTSLCVFDLSKHLMYGFYYNQMKTAVWTALPATVHRFELPAPRNPDRWCVPGHDQACMGALRHFELPERLPTIQHWEREGAWKDERRMRWTPYRRICQTAPKDVQHPWGQWKEHQESQWREKEHREEAHPPRAEQRGPLRKADLSTRNGRSAVRATSQLWAAFEQGIAPALRLQALDRRKWSGHTGLWAQRCNPCRLSSSTLCPRKDPIRRQLCVRGHNKKFLADEPPRWPVEQVIQHSFIGFGHRASEPIHLERPYWISRTETTTI